MPLNRSLSPILLRVHFGTSFRRARRQDEDTFVNEDGTTSRKPCTEASIYLLTDDGRLQIGGQYISRPLGIDHTTFASSSYIPGKPWKTFTYEADGLLKWTNETFDGGQARFCVSLSNILTVIFHGLFPDGCLEVSLLRIPCASFFPYFF